MTSSSISVRIKNASSNTSTSPYGIGMPPQKLAFKAKDEEWRKACINAIISMGTSTTYNGRTSRHNKEVNYNLVNSIFDEKDFLYVTDPWGIGTSYGEAPARMENYNIIRNVVEFLKGDDLRRPFSFTAVAVNGEAVSVRQEYKANMLKEALAQYVQNEEAKYGINQPTTDEQGNPVEPKTPQQIEEYMSYTYKDIVEKQTNDILNYLYKKEDIVQKFVEGWEHGIIAGEELYHVGISYNEPILRVVNPLFFDYDKNPDTKTIEDSQWCREERFMTKGEVLDEYREYLTNEDLERLDMNELGMANSMSKFDTAPGFSYDYNNQSLYNVSANNRSNYINVNVVCWKTWKKIGFFNYIDPNSGEPVKKIVEEGFKVPSEFLINNIEYTLEWEWINEVWSGVRIGNEIFVNIGPIDNQCRTINNPSLCKMPYVGRVYNAVNSVSTSIVDLVKKYQFFYNTIMYRVELEIAKAQGKKIIIDIAQMPRSGENGMTLDKWMYYYSNTGIAFINSMEEGRPGDPNTVSKFNQFTSLDMSVGNLTTYLNILNKLEESVEKITGVTRQRLGETFSSESATGIQNSVIQSSIITEYMYFQHNNVKKEVLTQLVEAAKIAYQNNKAISYITDDMQRIAFGIDSEKMNNSDVAVFISNSTKDLEVKQKTEGLLQAAMQNDKAAISDIINIYKSNSTAELSNIAKKIDLKHEQQLQQQQQLEQEAQERQIQHEAEMSAIEREERQLDRDNKIAIAEIGAYSFAASTDTPEDNTQELSLKVNEILGKREEANKKTKLEYDKLIANQINDEYRLGKESQMQDKELNYKQKELASKEKIAKMKPKPASKKK